MHYRVPERQRILTDKLVRLAGGDVHLVSKAIKAVAVGDTASLLAVVQYIVRWRKEHDGSQRPDEIWQ